MANTPEPSVEPEHLLKSLRRFLAVAQPASVTIAEPETDLCFEEAGTLVWDAVALPDDAAFLLSELADLPGMLATTLTTTAAAEQWRALEIGLGILGNLGCHAQAKQQLLEQEGLPELLLGKLAWVDDAASLAELLRAVANLLATAGSSPAGERWWALLLRDETLGRLVWIMENTLSTILLERALKLLVVVVGRAAAVAAAGVTAKQQMVPLVISLDLLQLLASVLTGWLVRLRAEHRHFGGSQNAAGKRKRSSPSPDGWGGGREQEERGDRAAAENDTAPATAVAAAADPEAETPAELAASAVVAAEVSEIATLEALTLLEVLAADPAGEQALAASGPVQHALVCMIAESENHDMQALSSALLAGMAGAGGQLLAHPSAVAVVLARLAEHAPPDAGRAAAGSTEEQAEEVEAGWALISALARALSQQQVAGEAKDSGDEEQEQDVGTVAVRHHAACVDELLGMLSDNLDLLCSDWGSSSNGASLLRHQAYVLGQIAPLLAARPGVESDQHAALKAALEHFQAVK